MPGTRWTFGTPLAKDLVLISVIETVVVTTDIHTYAA